LKYIRTNLELEIQSTNGKDADASAWLSTLSARTLNRY
jgi:hypothetical protein